MHIPHLHIPHLHLEGYKGMLHMAMVFVVLFKIHVIDRKLNFLEKRAVNK